MTTKRRKVWVAFYGDDEHRSFSSQKRAKSDASDVAQFVERLPGDVVLSREEAADIRKRLTGMVERGELSTPAAAIDIAAVINALLRGAR